MSQGLNDVRLISSTALRGAMRRREFFMLIGGATVAWAVAARAQLTTKMPRIGILSTGRSEPHCEASRLPINPLANELRQSQCFARL
jgi:hypothetical protein